MTESEAWMNGWHAHRIADAGGTDASNPYDEVTQYWSNNQWAQGYSTRHDAIKHGGIPRKEFDALDDNRGWQP